MNLILDRDHVDCKIMYKSLLGRQSKTPSYDMKVFFVCAVPCGYRDLMDEESSNCPINCWKSDM